MNNVLITGAAKGIGRAVALKFAENNYTVFINYNKSKTEAEALCSEIIKHGENAAVFQADVSDKTAVDVMVSAILQKYKHIDVLVNNAGISQLKPFTDLTEEDLQKMFNVNINGTFFCSQAVIPGMITRKNGAVINVSSIWGQCGSSCETHYSASKAAVIGFTKALAKELAPSNIKVNCVCPGAVKTDMNSSLTTLEINQIEKDIPLGRFAEPAEIAEAIFFLAQSNYITGQTLSVNGGWL